MALTFLAKTVTSSGTRVQLSATSLPCAWAIIQPARANSGKIFIGDVTVGTTGILGYTLDTPVANVDLSNLRLPPVASGPNTIDLSEIYVDTSASGCSVNVIYSKG